jgi:hypothetical protein
MNWKELERHPLSAAYKDIGGTAWKRFKEDLKKHGIVNGRCVTLHEGKVFDGWQLQRACVEADIEPEYRTLQLPEGMDPEEAVQIVNDNRRHETAKQIDQRVKKRRARVAAARRKGESTRAIAEAEGISQKQVRDDLKDSGEYPYSPETNGTAKHDSPPATVKGKDGKTYSATATKRCRACRTGNPNPFCSECKALNAEKNKEREPGDDTEIEEAARKRQPKNKSGHLWDWKKLEEGMGILQREIVNAGKPHHAHNTAAALGLGRELMEWRNRFKEWAKSLTKGSG